MKRCAMWRTPAATAAPRATRPCLRVGAAVIAGVERRRAVRRFLARERGQVLGEIVERALGRPE